ncbi:MAG: anthranilate synthase component I [Candidatus Lambdaproteobacteria bacterium]|nr:anthranilate synthase component I [Candidatus Lambdaproteobacteria bacterium]
MASAETEIFRTAGGLTGRRHTTAIDPAGALDHVWQGIDRRKGALFVSNYEVPDRYARWDIGYIDAPVELVAWERRFALNALNGEGERLLAALAPALRGHPHVRALRESPRTVAGEVVPPPSFFPEEARSRQPSVFSIVRALLAHLRCEQGALGFYGAFGYDLVFQFETLRQRMPRQPELPDCHLMLPTDVVVVDRRKEHAQRIVFDFDTPLGPSRAGGQGGAEFPPPLRLAPAPVTSDHAPGEFERKVQRIREGCQRGDFFEVVLSQSFSMPYAGTPSELFRRICRNNPSPYSFLINMGEEQLVGASPEMYVRAQGRRVETSPISGTVAVGESPMETAAQIKHLISSDKEESELTMCTDVDRNDMTRVCVPGTVRLIGRRLIETYSRLVHTVDHVEGELAEPYDALDAFVTHLWACTVTGSPKPAALQIIEELEASPRRWYSGAVGYLAANGDLNTGMTLRTIRLDGGRATVRSGATLLYDSDPASEERETRIKASAFLEAALGEKPPARRPGGEGRVAAGGAGRRVLFVDFRDSFVHTLASYVRITGAEVTTVRAGFPEAVYDQVQPDLVFLSPGPGTPAEQGVHDVVRQALARELPLFGVCLGHQGMAEVFGAELGVFETPMHGKPSAIRHTGRSVFAGLPSPFNAGRYHSLYVKRETVPPELEILAETDDGVIMALAHRSLPIVTLQFHPESILTLEQEIGQRLIENLFTRFLDAARPRPQAKTTGQPHPSARGRAQGR